MAPLINHIRCSSALNRSGIPSVDWCINPYVGCAHACLYCYASFMTRFSGHTEPWGRFVDVKTNLVEVLVRQLRRKKSGTVVLSSATEAYQPIERETELTRRCLRALADSDLSVSILTKSDLVLRDLDIIKSFGGLLGERRIEVGFSITTLDPKLARLLEPGAPSPALRLAALQTMAAAGIPTWVFVSPIIPGLTDSEVAMEQLVSEAGRRGAGQVMCDPLNFYSRAVHQLRSTLRRHAPGAVEAFEQAQRHQEEWKSRVIERFEAAGGRSA
ncbi:MAG: radical SAM protein [Bradymonadales bacterium]|nr:radical SAM protein [Bradymonadales bacterium]